MSVSHDPISSEPNLSKSLDGEYDPLALENQRLSQEELNRPAVKPALLSISVRTPRPLEFIRVHPDPEYRLGPVNIIVLHREFYLVDPRLKSELRPREYSIAQIFLMVNSLEVPALWVAKIQSATGRTYDWYTSALDCAEYAMTRWGQLEADHDLGMYKFIPAEEDLGEPEFPDKSMQELIRLGFKHRIVDSLDHLVMKQLRGRK